MKTILKLFLLFQFVFYASALAQQQSDSADNPLWSADKRPDIRQTLRAISKWHAQGKTPAEISDMLNMPFPTGGSSIISGDVFQSPGQNPLPVAFQVTVYDLYGLYESSVYVNAGISFYAVGGLAAGDHYVHVYAYGNYLEEFYDGTGDWQNATLVQTLTDSIVSGINFQLEMGKVISGKVLDDTSLEPLAGRYATFYLYDENTASGQDYKYFYNSISADGSYYLSAIHPGNYKLKILNEEYISEFYSNKAELSSADVIQVAAGKDTVEFINFLIARPLGVQDGYEPNAVYNDAYAFTIGQSLSPQINPMGDRDFFTSMGNQGDSVDIEVKARSIGSSLVPHLTLYDSTASQLYSVVNPDILLKNFVLPYTGRYYLSVMGNSNQTGGADYFYELSVRYSSYNIPAYASISGQIFLDNETTPYKGSGYNIILVDKDTYQGEPYFFTDSVYVIRKIAAGTYFLGVSPQNPGYIGEWFDNVYNINEASPITLSETDSISDINFVISRSGGISGRLFLDNLLMDYTEGGSLYLYSSNTNQSSNSFDIVADAKGLFTVSGIAPGNYSLQFYPALSAEYPPVWYGNVGSRGGAMQVTVVAGDTTDNITIILKRGGMIRGFINQSAQDMSPLGNDSLNINIIPYDILGFNVNNNTSNTFTGGYRSALLYPGTYKLQALAQNSTLASWYYDTGSHFDDPGSKTIDVVSGGLLEVPITMSVANGTISGIIYKKDGVTPAKTTGYVFAYDQTGHIVQIANIGLDPQSGQLLDEGHYRISGLKSGTYYLMLIDYATMDFTLKWYPDIVIENRFINSLFFMEIPAAAMAVDVTDPGEISGIDFKDPVNSISVEKNALVPEKFELAAIHPNPFNPSTTLTYSVPQQGRVVIEIFDILGRKVSTVLDEIKSAGWHQLKWNGKNQFNQKLSSGIYFARLQGAGTVSSKKMILLK